MLTPAYRLRMFAPRSVDATEATLLSPRAGAAHSDPFKIATVQGVTGYQPYLAELPKGRRSAIDLLTKSTDIGALLFRVGDHRTGADNFHRWATAFAGDANGEDQFKGRRVEVDESVDFDPTNPGAATWSRFFTGRVVEGALNGRLSFDLTVHEMVDDLDVSVFTGAPASTVSGFASQTQLYPLGLIQDYGPFPVELTRVVATVTHSASDYMELTVNRTGTQRTPKHLAMTKALGDLFDALNDAIASGGTLTAPKALATVRVIAGGATSDWSFTGGQRGSSLITAIVQPIAGVSGAPLTVGTVVDFYVKALNTPTSDTVPVLINNVHPATFIRYLLSGAFGNLTAAGAPLWSVPYDPTTFAALEADPSFFSWRSIERKSITLHDAISAVCRHAHIVYYPDALGRIAIADARRSSLIAPAATLTSADMVTDTAPTWKPDAAKAVTAVQASYKLERLADDAELPKPWESTPTTGYPDVPVFRIDDNTDSIVRAEMFGPRVGDVKASDFTLDSNGLRCALGSGLIGSALLGDTETVNGKSRRDVIEAYLAQYAGELEGVYCLGPTSDGMEFKRSAVAGVTQGSYVVLSIDELPDPASNTRGGSRLAIVVERIENGASVTLTCVDAGANAVAVTPTLGAPAAVTGDTSACTVAVTLDAAADPVQLQVAVTAPGTGAAPATGWVDVVRVAASGSALVSRLASNARVWVRGRSTPAAGSGFKLPSAWVTAGHFDVAALGAPSALVVTDANGYASLTWTPADAAHVEEVFVTLGAAPGTWTDAMRVQRLQPGSARYVVGPLALGQQYTVGVCAIDDAGGASAVTSSTFVCGSSITLDPPSDPTGFAGTHDANGMSIPDGTYGLAVAAVVYPGFVEFTEAVETAHGSGIFGTTNTVGRVPAVQGDWTTLVRSAPNDGRKRQLAARSVADPATPSTYTDGAEIVPWVPQELPPFARTVGSTELTNLKFVDPDQSHRTWSWVRGSRVAFVWLYDRLELAPVSADPWPNVTDLPDAVLATGTDSYTATKPSGGFQRFIYIVPWYKSGGVMRRGTAVRLVLDPAPAALGAKIKATVTNATADLSIEIAGGVADWPVRADVYADNPDVAPIATFTLNASGTKTKLDDAALGGLVLPDRAARHFWLKLTNVAGVQSWAHTSADRDALPSGAVTVRDYSATPSILVDYDDDTDAVRVTTPTGHVKTFTPLAGVGTVTYTVGMVLDDATTETPLVVDGARTGYLVEVQGGGTWLAAWRGDLHGHPSHPPRVRPRAVISADGSSEDAFVELETNVAEDITLLVRIGEGSGAPVYALCVSAGDGTPLYVSNGTEVGPSNFFKPTVGSPAAILGGVALGRDQITRYYGQAVGKDSGISSDWVPIVFSLLAKPYVESFALTWDDVAQVLRFRGKCGPHSKSWFVELDDNAAFSSPLTFSGNANDGDEFTNTQTLSGANRGKVWYGRATTYSEVGQAGLSSVQVVDERNVPSLVSFTIATSETAGTGTLTLVLNDPGGQVDPTARVGFYVTQNGVRTLETATTAPTAGSTTGTYTKAKALLEEHTTLIEPLISMLDGSQITPGGETFDADSIANVVNLDSATNGPNATIVATFDTDTVAWDSGAGTGTHNGGRYRIDGGSWTTFDVDAATRTAQITVTLSTTATELLEVEGLNGAGAWGPAVSTRLPVYIASTGPTLDVKTLVSDVSCLITWSGTGTVQVSINGGTYGTPAASPITVNRSLTADQTYNFRATLGGVTVPGLAVIPAQDGVPTANTLIDSNGSWTTKVDGPAKIASYRYVVSYAAQPSDASVASGGTVVNGSLFSLSNVLGALALGQTLFITIIGYTQVSAAGKQLSALHVVCAYTKSSATKFDTYVGASFVVAPAFTATVTQDSATGKLVGTTGLNPAKNQGVLGVKISNSVTITSVSMYAKLTFSSGGSERIAVSVDAISKSSGGSTNVGQVQATSSSGAVQLVTSSGLSHTVDSNNNTYQASVLITDPANSATALELWSITIGYTQNNQSQGT